MTAVAIGISSDNDNMRLHQRPLPPLSGFPSWGTTLLKTVANINLPFGCEYSFKMNRSNLLTNRVLFSINKMALGQQQDKRVINICRQLYLPDELLDQIADLLKKANIFHLGYEQNQSSHIYKVYFEYENSFRMQHDDATRNRQSIHLCSAIKWDATSPEKHTITEYTVYPFLGRQQMLDRILATYGNNPVSVPYRKALEIYQCASEKIHEHDIFYLEASEPGNPRQSYDINIYNAELPLAFFEKQIRELIAYFGVSPDEFDRFFTPVKSKTFGHMSSGIDRNGEDFFSVYYGVEGY